MAILNDLWMTIMALINIKWGRGDSRGEMTKALEKHLANESSVFFEAKDMTNQIKSQVKVQKRLARRVPKVEINRAIWLVKKEMFQNGCCCRCHCCCCCGGGCCSCCYSWLLLLSLRLLLLWLTCRLDIHGKSWWNSILVTTWDKMNAPLREKLLTRGPNVIGFNVRPLSYCLMKITLTYLHFSHGSFYYGI